MRSLFSFLSIAVFLAAAASASAQDRTLSCFDQNIGPETRIETCTAFLNTSDLPDDTRALALSVRAEALVSLDQNESALGDFGKALELTPGDLRSRLGRAEILKSLDRGNEAIADYTVVIDRAPVSEPLFLAEAYAGRAALRMQAGEVDAGIVDLGEARRFDPRNPEPFKIRGSYFLDQGDLEQAVAELEQAVNLNAGDVEAQTQLGTAQLRLGRSEEAVRAFSSALIVQPRSIEALRGRAKAYGQLENYAASIADYSAALSLDEKDETSLEGRGVALLRIGSYAAAKTDFDALLELRPRDAGVLFFRANALFQNGDPVGAEADFTEVLTLRPGDMDALVGRGIARQFNGDYEGSEEDLTAVLKSVPDAAQPLAHRGYTRMMRGDFAAAAHDFRKAMELPNAPHHLALWRFVAETRSGERDETLLGSLKARLESGEWPLPIVRYFLGEVSGDEIINAAIDAPVSATGRLCEAYFFLGQAALILDDPDEAKRLFNAALATKAVRYTEYAGAKAELDRLTPADR